MPLNVPGFIATFHPLLNPRIILPGLVVKDIRQLDFVALREAGYRRAVFDKDNCLTFPHKDTLVPELRDAWRTCLETFGSSNVLIVSNTAGAISDAGSIQAESVSHHLTAPVLRHGSLKPSYACIASIRAYFFSLPPPAHPDDDSDLIVVGDRLLTDVIMANRMKNKGKAPLAVWTTGLWKRESMGLRWTEKKLLAVARWWTGVEEDGALVERFVRDVPSR